MNLKKIFNFTNLFYACCFFITLFCLCFFQDPVLAQGESSLDTIWENYPWTYASAELPASVPEELPANVPVELSDNIRSLNNRPFRIGNPSHYPTVLQEQQGRYIPYRNGAQYIQGVGISYELPTNPVNVITPAEVVTNSTEPFNRISVESSSYFSDEYRVNISQPKSGLFGKLKVGFGYFDSKLEEVYVKYHEGAKRKFYWKVWEKNRGNYSSYIEFKRDWDNNTDIWKKIRSELKKDIKSEVDGLLRTKRPFDNPRSVTNGRRRFIEDMLS